MLQVEPQQEACHCVDLTPLLLTEEEGDSLLLYPSCLLAMVEDMDKIDQQQNQEEQQQKRRRVAFNEETQVVPSVSPLACLKRTEWNRIWYQPADLGNFRTDARETCRRLRSLSMFRDNMQAHVCTMALDGVEDTRGFENRACLERQRRKYCSTQSIIAAAKSDELRGDPQRLASLAQKINQWATELAIQEASRDYVRAYQDSNNGQSKSQNRDPESIVMWTKKRAAVGQEGYLATTPPVLRRKVSDENTTKTKFVLIERT